MTTTTTTEQAAATPAANREILTYSALAKFRNCRRSFKHRYVDELRAREKSEALWIGSAFHDALHVGYLERKRGVDRAGALAAALKWLDNGPLLGAASDPARRGQRDLLLAMVRNYEKRWGGYRAPELADPLDDDKLEEIRAEFPFVVQIRNPETGRGSLTFQLAGKVDAVVRYDGRLFIKETKTAASIDGDYLAKLWADFQSQIYAAAISRIFGEPIAGVLYDVTAKSRIKRSAGETVQDWEERLLTYKTEKTVAKHREAGPKKEESDADFAARLDEWYAQPDAFIRQLVYFDAETLRNVEVEVWELTQQLLDARRREKWGQNTTQCYGFGTCPYVAICKNHGRIDETVSGFYESAPAHEELREVLPAGYAAGVDSDLMAEFDRIEAATALIPKPEVVPVEPTDAQIDAMLAVNGGDGGAPLSPVVDDVVPFI